MGTVRNFVDFIKDAFFVGKVTITSPWLWLMVGFGLYTIMIPWMMLAISPLTPLILPAILIIYLIINEDKRMATQYSLKKKAGSTSGAVAWNVKQSVDEYMQLLNKRAMIFTPDERPDDEKS